MKFCRPIRRVESSRSDPVMTDSNLRRIQRCGAPPGMISGGRLRHILSAFAPVFAVDVPDPVW